MEGGGLMDGATILQMALRWVHLVSGITWIGILYYFNLVNGRFLGSLDAETRSKVVPRLMTPALWYFRWGAVVTVLSGLVYFAWIVGAEGSHAALGKWLGLVIVLYLVMHVLLDVVKVSSGPVLAVAFLVLLVVLIVAVPSLTGLVSSRAKSIGVGGGLGVWMLLNVWGIIWRAQKKIIAWTADNAANGTAIPPEAARLGRVAFLASRTNAWLSLPMLFFMGSASHLPLFG